jgi:hypothetical protein
MFVAKTETDYEAEHGIGCIGSSSGRHGAAFRHDTFRIIGTITKPDQYVVEVKTKDGEIVAVRLENGTRISRDSKEADISELKAAASSLLRWTCGSSRQSPRRPSELSQRVR